MVVVANKNNGIIILEGRSTCIHCPAGREYVDTSTCNVCLGGWYQASSTTPFVNCTACPVGYFNSDTGSKRIGEKHEQCAACNITNGFVTGDQSGALFCIGCKAGTFTTKNVTVPCVDCPVGWKGVQDDQLNKCVQCPTGRTSEQGSTICQLCEAGTFMNVTGSERCKNCGAGQYRQKMEDGGITPTNATFCIDCPAGWSSESASTKCQPCEAGYIGAVVGQDCSPCGVGQYRPSKDVHGNLTDPTLCFGCPVGWSSEAGSTKCQPCDGGAFNDVGGQECKKCPLGSVSKSGAVQCITCELGKKTNNDNTTCDNCDLGKFGSTNDKCSDCPPGTYQDGKGFKTCKNCDKDTYSSESGKSSKSDCKECSINFAAHTSTNGITGVSDSIQGCVCDDSSGSSDEAGGGGFYTVSEPLFTEETSKADPKNRQVCIPCPTGANCTSNSLGRTELIHLHSKLGYWQGTNETDKFIGCAAAFSDVKLGEAGKCVPVFPSGRPNGVKKQAHKHVPHSHFSVSFVLLPLFLSCSYNNGSKTSLLPGRSTV